MANPIFGTEEGDIFKGGYAADMYFGAGGSDNLSGGYGNDTLYGGEGNDRLYGNENNDTLSGDEGADLLDGGTGSDTLIGGAGADKILGGAGDDLILAFSRADITGDVIDGGSGVDTLFLNFEDSASALKFTAPNPLTDYRYGTSFRIIGIEQYNISGSEFADVITGYLLSDQLSGGLGNDTLKGLDGFDVLSGDEGNDYLYGGNDTDFLDGGEGNDYVSGDNGSDIVQGGAGADRVFGGTGEDQLASGEFSFDGTGDLGTEIDTLNGGDGNDHVEMGVKDVADAGAGIDSLQLDFTNSAIGENFVFSNQLINFASGGSAVRFDSLTFFGGTVRDIVTGGSRADTLYGGGGSDSLAGGDGNDTIDGGVGNDAIRGGNGNDVLIDSAGADKLYGDAHDDTFYTSGFNGDADTFDGGANRDTVIFSSEGDLSGFLDLADQTKNDGQLLGDKFLGIEVFQGSDLDDFMFGASGVDTFYGGDGDDVLDGRAGNDYLHGGEGSDTMTGGAGNDIFDLSGQSLHGAWFGDIITDFTRGQDKLQISLEELGLTTPPAFSIVVGTDPVPNANGPQLLFNQTTHQLFFDEDGVGSEHEAMLVATLNNVTTLANSDIIFS